MTHTLPLSEDTSSSILAISRVLPSAQKETDLTDLNNLPIPIWRSLLPDPLQISPPSPPYTIRRGAHIDYLSDALLPLNSRDFLLGLSRGWCTLKANSPASLKETAVHRLLPSPTTSQTVPFTWWPPFRQTELILPLLTLAKQQMLVTVPKYYYLRPKRSLSKYERQIGLHP